MNYRLSRRELRIIEETKRGRENSTGDGDIQERPEPDVKISVMKKIQPYLYFALTFIIIAIALRLFVRFTS